MFGIRGHPHLPITVGKSTRQMYGTHAVAQHHAGWRAALAALIAALFMVLPAAAQQTQTPSIVSPADGQVLQRSVPVRVMTDIANYSSAELDFAYASDPTGTWFLIQAASLPATSDVMALWDTTLLTDGDYTLRLRVVLLDGSFRDATATVQVRNYTSAPTASPVVTPTAAAIVEIPTAMIINASQTAELPTAAPLATPSPLPPNPAGVTPSELSAWMWRGALIIVAAVVGFVALIRLRRY